MIFNVGIIHDYLIDKMNKLGSDLITHILGFCDPKSVFKAFQLNHSFYDLTKDDKKIWLLIQWHYPGFIWTYQSNLIVFYKKWTRIFTKEIFTSILAKIDNTEEIMDYRFVKPITIIEFVLRQIL